MKTKNLWKWILIAGFFLAILTACSAATPEPTPIPSTPTDVPPTAIPVHPTEIPKPTSCDDIDGTCLELTFDGASCTYAGPTDLKKGVVTVLFIDESDKLANMSLAKHTGDETLQDTIDYWEEGKPKHGHPSWAEWVFEEDASAGKRDTWEGNLQSGTQFLVCAQGLPLLWWLGVGFSVEN
jgi:hypothetical protein